jgi:hypothetical protein
VETAYVKTAKHALHALKTVCHQKHCLVAMNLRMVSVASVGKKALM